MRKIKSFKQVLMLLLITTLLLGTVTASSQEKANSQQYALKDMDMSSPMVITGLVFKNLRVDAAVEVEYVQSSENQNSMRIEGRDTEYFKSLYVQVIEDTLTIWSDKNNSRFYNDLDDDIHIYLEAPSIESIEVNGAGEFTCKEGIKQPSLFVYLSGAAEMEAKLDVEDLTVDAQGDCEFELYGSAVKASYTLQGICEGESDELKSNEIKCILQGSCSLEVYATELLNVQIDGMGEVEYKGNPSITKQIRGIGSIKPIN